MIRRHVRMETPYKAPASIKVRCSRKVSEMMSLECRSGSSPMMSRSVVRDGASRAWPPGRLSCQAKSQEMINMPSPRGVKILSAELMGT